MLKKLFIIFVLLLFVPTIGMTADKWSKQDKVLEATWLVLQVVDWRQTRQIAQNPYYWEMNPILGRYPSVMKVDIYFLVTAVLHSVITHYLPKKYRALWHTASIGASGFCVTHNSLELRIGF